MLEITFQFLELWTEILPYIDRQKVALDITKCKEEICEVKNQMKVDMFAATHVHFIPSFKISLPQPENPSIWSSER